MTARRLVVAALVVAASIANAPPSAQTTTAGDGFTGRAPDLGAYEIDRPVPLYGPRAAPKSATDHDAR